VLAPDGKITCGDWEPIGPDLTDHRLVDATGEDDFVAQLARAPGDTSTLWAATRSGRVFLSRNADAAEHVKFQRIDIAATPARFVSGITVDPADADHALVSYSGYDAYTPDTPGHVFDVRFDPAAGSATFSDRSFDLGDQPITGVALDDVTGDVYVSTDFGVLRLPAGGASWEQVGTGLPLVAVYGLTIAPRSRLLYAATHGRGAWRRTLPSPVAPPTPRGAAAASRSSRVFAGSRRPALSCREATARRRALLRSVQRLRARVAAARTRRARARYRRLLDRRQHDLVVAQRVVRESCGAAP
jgi:hypothetical protein